MRGTIRNMSTVFNQLAASRRAAGEAARTEGCKFAVHFLKKNGAPRKDATDVLPTREAAEARARQLESYNPGATCVVIEVA